MEIYTEDIEEMVHRFIWTINGSNLATNITESNSVYKKYAVTNDTLYKFTKYLESKGMGIKEDYREDLLNEWRRHIGEVGSVCGHLWRFYPNYKSDTPYTLIGKSIVAPDLKSKIERMYAIEKRKIDDILEKFGNVVKDINNNKDVKLNIPHPELSRYIESFPKTVDEYIDQRSKVLVDQLYLGLLNLSKGKMMYLTGYTPVSLPDPSIDPDINIMLGKAPCLPEFMYVQAIMKDKDIDLVICNRPATCESDEINLKILNDILKVSLYGAMGIIKHNLSEYVRIRDGVFTEDNIDIKKFLYLKPQDFIILK